MSEQLQQIIEDANAAGLFEDSARKGFKNDYIKALEKFSALQRARYDESYLLEVIADIRQAVGGTDKLMLNELAPEITKRLVPQRPMFKEVDYYIITDVIAQGLADAEDMEDKCPHRDSILNGRRCLNCEREAPHE